MKSCKLTKTGLNVSVSYVGKEDSITTKRFKSTNVNSTKDTSDFVNILDAWYIP